MGSLSIGVYMNQFSLKKRKEKREMKKINIKSTIPLRVRHLKKYKIKPFFSINIK